MKLCDRCYHRGEYKPGPHQMKIADENFDLCTSCYESIRGFINDTGSENRTKREPLPATDAPETKRRKPGRPKAI